jgi:hypothetical protein
MSTRALIVFALGMALGTSACATNNLGQPSVTLDEGRWPVKVLSAYLTDDDLAVVRGVVRRAILHPWTVAGHLHVTAFAQNGSVLARRTTSWRGSMGGRWPTAVFYSVSLGVPRAQVAHLAVAYAPDRHAMMEGFQ